MSRSTITAWDPEDSEFWETSGRRIASRNMWTSVFAEHIGFCVWSLWSVLVLFMTPETGFTLTAGDKFLLVSLVTAVGSAVRPGYGYLVTRLGGRTWTALSAVMLLIPAGGGNLGVASVQLAGLLVIAAAGRVTRGCSRRCSSRCC